MNADELRAWLVEAVAAAAGLAPADVGADEPFASQGLDSARLAQLAGELERLLGRRIDPPVLFEHPTIEQLAAHLAGARRSDSELERSRAPTSVPLAIVGLACRMPKAPDLESFWRLLEGAVDAVGEPPADRPAADHGGFLDDVASFDARFFRISADEARRMDPQQRLLLETSLEALEDAGLVPASLRASRTGVFVGISAAEYALRQLESRPTIGPYTVTGNALSIAANRLSYAFDLRGPSVAVDTACSSSLVALHLAVRAIRAGDCDRAGVAGANVPL